MQQDTRTITIELVDKTNSQMNNNQEIDTGTGASAPNSKVKSPTDIKIAGKSLFWNYAAKRAYSVLKQATISTANRYWSLTEDYISQNSFNNASNALGEAIGFGATIAAGFTVGGVYGGAIAAVGYGVSKAVSTVNEYSNIRQSINANNYNMQFQRTRMGLVDNGRGTEN